MTTLQKSLGSLRDNPIILKDLRVRMRGGRTFVVMTGYLALLSGAAGLILILFTTSQDSSAAFEARQQLGKTMFWVVAAMQLLAMCFIGPALTAGTVSSEKEQRTYDLVRTTLLTPRAYILGKLLTSVAFLFLLLLTSLPIQSLALLFGGITPAEILIAVLVLLVSGLGFSAIGLAFSTFSRRTLIATVMSYAATLLIVFGIPLFLVVAVSVLQVVGFGFLDNDNSFWQFVVLSLAWWLIAANPLATGIVTEVILIEEQSALFFNLPVSNTVNFPFVSPWIGYTIIYLMVTLILVGAAIRRVRQPDR